MNKLTDVRKKEIYQSKGHVLTPINDTPLRFTLQQFDGSLLPGWKPQDMSFDGKSTNHLCITYVIEYFCHASLAFGFLARHNKEF